ncbi:hypothetical protein Psuf_018570 [Phytohabitans suffuscus]|uniref:Luciferase-like domain-containing protein n=1 Tax=Phytohabitans suffuscus TaxID=624315 RepID=A0A6F8YEH9_9ACTN|nr:LLM class flavin-dependent oxidoreductase [Phytohabitans suffuscus]BCB84544.1 hypothetical protein Psuf_018570 [Phytohabitans suffuscus]
MDTLTFGLQLCVQHPAHDDMGKRLAETIEQVNLARDIGFDSIVLGQHYLSSPLQMMQPVPLLARLAPESGDLKLVIGIVLAALANPVDVAEQIATLDVITDGRVRLGLGLGYRAVEFDAFGVPKDQRLRRFIRNAKLITSLLAGDRVSHDAPDIRLDDVGLTLRPQQTPARRSGSAPTTTRRYAGPRA